MDKPHKQVITTDPVAIKFGQARLHVQNPIPWLAKGEPLKCPKCETVFFVSEGFPKAQLLNALETQHENQEPHPDLIPSEPTRTRILGCDCGM